MYQVIYAILVGIAGSVAWDKLKDSVPVLESLKGWGLFGLGWIALALALMTKFGTQDSNAAAPDGASPVTMHRQRRNFFLGVLMLVIYVLVVSKLAPSQASGEQKAASASVSAPALANAAPTQSPPKLSASLASPRSENPAPIFDAAYLKRKQSAIGLAAQGHVETIEFIRETLGTPLHSQALTPAFFKQKYFERALAGEPDLFADQAIPAALDRIVVLRIDRSPPQKADFAAGAIRVKESISIAIIDARQGRYIFRKKIVVEGAGFNQESAHQALREDITRELAHARDIIASGAAS